MASRSPLEFALSLFEFQVPCLRAGVLFCAWFSADHSNLGVAHRFLLSSREREVSVRTRIYDVMCPFPWILRLLLVLRLARFCPRVYESTNEYRYTWDTIRGEAETAQCFCPKAWVVLVVDARVLHFVCTVAPCVALLPSARAYVHPLVRLQHSISCFLIDQATAG